MAHLPYKTRAFLRAADLKICRDCGDPFVVSKAAHAFLLSGLAFFSRGVAGDAEWRGAMIARPLATYSRDRHDD
jgi:hypothetical protein